MVNPKYIKTVECHKCHKLFTAPTWKKNSKFCSRECTRNRTTVTCCACGKQSVRRLGQIKGMKHTYCSHACRSIASNAKRITSECQYCGNLIPPRKPEQYNRQTNHFCSTKCSLIAMQKGNRGINNCEWKGDDATSSSIHKWLTKNKPKPERCQRCGKKKPLDFSFKGHHEIPKLATHTRNPDDYECICRKCHINLDRHE